MQTHAFRWANDVTDLSKWNVLILSSWNCKNMHKRHKNNKKLNIKLMPIFKWLNRCHGESRVHTKGFQQSTSVFSTMLDGFVSCSKNKDFQMLTFTKEIRSITWESVVIFVVVSKCFIFTHSKRKINLVSIYDNLNIFTFKACLMATRWYEQLYNDSPTFTHANKYIVKCLHNALNALPSCGKSPIYNFYQCGCYKEANLILCTSAKPFF